MPTATFAITANGDDNTIETTGLTYPPTTTVDRYNGAFGVNQAGRSLSGGTYYVRVGLLRFDTSLLPDTAVITAASLRLAYADRNWLDSSADYRMTADFYQWDGASNSDYTFAAQTGAITTPSSLWRTVTPTPGTTFDIQLDSVVGIAQSGYTYMRLFFTDPLPGGPTSLNYINYYELEYDTANSTNFSPKLIVTYTVPAGAVRLAPDAILQEVNLTGAVASIQDDPDSPDASWLLAVT